MGPATQIKEPLEWIWSSNELTTVIELVTDYWLLEAWFEHGVSDTPAVLLRRVLVWFAAHDPSMRGRVGRHRGIAWWPVCMQQVRMLLRGMKMLMIPTEACLCFIYACCGISAGGPAERPISRASAYQHRDGGY